MSRIAFPADSGQDMEHSAERPAANPDAVPMARVYGVLLVGLVCIGFSAIFTKNAHVPGTVSGFYRLAIAAVVLAPLFMRNARRGGVVRGRRIWLLAAAAGLFFMLDVAFWNTSLSFTNAANATLLGNDAPIFVGLVALLVFRERLRISYWLGLAIALCGMGIIVGLDIFRGSGLGAGDLLAMLAGVFYALYMLVTQRVRVWMDTLSSLWISTVVGTLLLLTLNLALGRALWGFTPPQYIQLFALGLVSQVIAYLAINYALGHLPASVVSPTLLGQPVLTALLAVPLLSEMLEPRQIIGGAVALVGIFLVNRSVAK
ncbi:MAG TPA: DMT family transporter [Ktedonobacterales bacterium]